MNWFYQTLLEPWTHTYFVKAALGGSIVAVSCAVLGCYIILRKMAFIGDAMSHALLPGVGVGYLVMNALFAGGFTAGGLLLGALIAAVLTSVSISFLSSVNRIAEDTAIGIIYTGLFAGGVVILTRFQQYINIDLNHFFQGDVYGISWADMWLGAVVGAIVVGSIILFYRYFTIVSFDPTMAASIGIPTRFIHITLTGMIALVCVAGISMVGAIMIVGLLITPAALAYLFTDRLPKMMFIAALVGVISVISGLYFSEWVNASGGGSIMFVGFLLFLVGLVIAPRYGLLAGWLRRARMVPESDIEDILKAAYEKQHTNQIPIAHKRLKRALKRMTASGLISERKTPDSLLSLTEKGKQEAAHIMRAHQLWEGRLVHQGMNETEAHEAAERLEHLHPREVLDSFDEELNHPLKDSHGKKIPGEMNPTEEEPPLILALLRFGDRAKVVHSDTTITSTVSEGDILTIGKKHEGESPSWEIERQDGQKLILSHKQADKIIVKKL